MTTTIQRRTRGALAATILLFLSGLGWMNSVGAAEGQLTQIGGNGPTTCERTSAEIGLTQLPPPPGGISGGGFRRTPGVKAIASDMYGRALYMAYGSQILDRTSIIAGVYQPPVDPSKPALPPARQDEGAPAAQTDLSGLETIAVHPFGSHLWVALPPKTIPDPDSAKVETIPGRIRQLDLADATKPVTTFKTLLGSSSVAAMAADGKGNLYVAESTGALYRLNAAGNRTDLATVTAPTGMAVDVTGSHLYVSGQVDTTSPRAVYRVVGSSLQMIAGGTILHRDSGSSSMNPVGLAIGHEIDGGSPTARYLYIADFQMTDLQSGLSAGRVVRVDLKENPPVITTVAGGGRTFTSSAEDARTANLAPKFLAADIAGHVYIAASDQCAIFSLQTPPPFRLNPAVTNPPAATNTTLPSGGSRTGDNESTAADPAPAGNGNPQVDAAPGGQPAGQGTQTQIVPGSQTQVQPQPQTELRIIDQGNVVPTPDQAGQLTVDPVPTPGPAAQFTPTPTPTPTPAADVSAVVVPDAGPSGAAVAEVAPVAPPAPGPAPASAPPPAAQQPVSNVGLAHGDSAAPARSATRYAMVRNDEEQSLVAALAMAGAGAGIVAVFLCVMFVAPGASSKPKPRPKGAY